MENKQYKIETLSDVVDVVNKENIERFLKDFSLWLTTTVNYYDNIRKILPVEYKEKRNSELAKAGFTWIDDFKNDLLGVNLKNSETGEEKFYPNNK